MMAGDASDFRQALGRILAAWWKAGGHVSAEEVRKYMQPFAEKVVLFESQGMAGSDVFRTLVSDVFPDGPWQGAVALNQLFYLAEAENAESWQEMEERLKKFLEKWNQNPINLSALLVAWRVKSVEAGGHPLDILDAVEFDPSRESYFDPEKSAGGAEFFLHILRNDYGVDVDPLLASIKEALGGERYVGEFLRLVDVDLPMGPDEFVRRVEQAVNVILKAREQGLSVGRIVEVWDALADGGGERLERLADAVRVVAEEEVRRRFWEEVRKAFEENGVHVFPDTPVDDIMEKAYYAGLIDIVDGNVTLTGLRDIISRLSMLLRTVRPIPMFRTREVEDALQRVAMDHKVLDVLERLPRRALKVYFETPLWPYVLEGIRKYEGDVTERLVDVLLEIEAGNIDRGEDVLRMLLAD